ncbi:MAG: DUF2130 domain-containing protein [Candidatus Geothermincolia bacterium]
MDTSGISVTCPNCGTDFPLTDAIEQRFLEEMGTKLEEQQKELAAQAAEQRKQLEAEKKKLEEAARKKAAADFEAEKKAFQEDAAAKDEQIEKFREQELKLRKEKRELDEAKKDIEIEVARKIDEERTAIKKKAAEEAAEQHHLKDKQKDDLIDKLNKQLEDMQRQVEQGSMERQGEALETDLEDQLHKAFPYDEIEPVAKGVRGADIIQRIKNQYQEDCGTIIWEAKNAKNWSGSWVNKLKQNQRHHKAEVAVILSTVMPTGVTSFDTMDGIWVCERCFGIPLASVLRHSLIQIAETAKTQEDRTDKKEMVYAYVTGIEFKQKVEAIVEVFRNMRNDLNKERDAMLKLWAKREKQIDGVITNTVTLYGHMEGIAGGVMPAIDGLDIKAIAGAPENGEME